MPVNKELVDYVLQKGKDIDFAKAVKKQEPSVSELESAIRGGAQGLTFGFADELTGLGESVFTDKTYEQARDESRRAYRMAQEANPGTYLAGQVGGAALPAVVSFGASAPVSAASLGRVAATAALQGALQGVGESEAQSLGDLAKDAAVGGAIGGVTGGVVGGLGRQLPKLTRALPSGTAIKEGLENRIGGVITGLSDEGIDVLRKTPDALRRVERLGEGNAADVIARQAEKIEGFLKSNPIANRINNNYTKATGLLDGSSVLVSTNPLKKALQKRAAKLDIGGQKAFGEQAQATLNYIDNFATKLDQAFPDGQIDAPNAKRVLDQIRKDVDKYGGFANPFSNSEIGDTLIDVQKALDSQLKSQVPGYADIMKQVQKDTVLNKRLTQQFFKRNEGVDINKIQQYLKRQTSVGAPIKERRLAEQLSGDLGEDLGQTIDDIQLKRMLEARGNQGSNLVNAGAAAGALADTVLGLPFGVATGLGALAGKRLETTGRKLTSSYFENYANKMPNILAKANGTKYAPVLQRAAQQGARQFAVTNYLLQQQDPEYRMMSEGLESGE